MKHLKRNRLRWYMLVWNPSRIYIYIYAWICIYALLILKFSDIFIQMIWAFIFENSFQESSLVSLPAWGPNSQATHPPPPSAAVGVSGQGGSYTLTSRKFSFVLLYRAILPIERTCIYVCIETNCEWQTWKLMPVRSYPLLPWIFQCNFNLRNC